MLLLLVFAFLAGIVTVLSPCILPLLPIILSSSGTSGKQKPFGVVVGFVISFTFFTLLLSTIVRLSGVSAESLRFLSILILLIFGTSLLIPAIQLQTEILFSRLANKAPSMKGKSSFFGGVVIGLSLGLLWTPCVGPILASVISLALTGTVNAQAFAITFAYAFGTAIPMFTIMLLGSHALQKVPWLASNTGMIQKAFGMLMMVTAIGIYFNVDRRFQTFVITTFPQYGVGLTRFEDTAVIKDQLNKLNDQPVNEDAIGKPMQESRGVPAPELQVNGKWFNSDPLQIKDLRGKVVLIDFWTYTCINCQRTLPYLKSWWEKYADKGLVIIGVHSPEFEFEKSQENVQQALSDFSIPYPIMQDNEFLTWKAYDNRYWPAKYLLDVNGSIRYTHFGEGEYDETEKMIQELLSERGEDISSEEVTNESYEIYARTPELYLGYSRIQYLASPEKIIPESPAEFTSPNQLPRNSFGFQGVWTVTPEYAAANTGSALFLNFDAKEVFLVARPKNDIAGKMKVYMDGELQAFGADSQNGEVTIDVDRLYKLIKLPASGRHNLKIEFLDSEIEIYAFTFG